VADAGVLAGQLVEALPASEQAEQHGTQCRPAVGSGAALRRGRGSDRDRDRQDDDEQAPVHGQASPFGGAAVKRSD
jgi:hypothetical protein